MPKWKMALCQNEWPYQTGIKQNYSTTKLSAILDKRQCHFGLWGITLDEIGIYWGILTDSWHWHLLNVD
jgi:hypothetical protein